ncbi:MAG: thioredoxin [Clostridia bacterium]|nr:thioredoxin [Clostridia bacterium]MBQ7122976.1 thioredoxin [Clostridia bacterium]
MIYMSSALAVNKESFRKEVLESEKTVLVDFWAAWCGPCRMLSPVIDEIAAENSDIKVVKINVDEQPELAQEFNIMTIPSLLVFKNGELVNQSAGVKPKPLILQMIK